MSTIVHLNEGTQIEIKESKAKLKELIIGNNDKDGNFIEVTMNKLTVKSSGFFMGKAIPVPEYEEIKIELYIKRILFFYDYGDET